MMANQETQFFACAQCGTVIEEISGNQDEYPCSGRPLKKLTPNTSEGAQEKHLPVVEQDGKNITVKVGSVFHPMTEEHSIEWVSLQTRKGSQRVRLNPNAEPVAQFVLADGDEAVAAYAYCNLHGFWKTQI